MKTGRSLRRALVAAGLALLVPAAGAQAQAAGCPPAATVPTPGQMQAAQAAARDRGFLWRIERDGRASYLFGTVHLGKLEWAFPGPALRAAIEATDTLALEIDATDAATLKEIAAAVAAGPPLDGMPQALAGRLRRQVEAACLPPQALSAQHPVMQAVTLVLLAARWEGLDPAFGQEAMLAGTARARGVPIVALETAASQVATLVPADAQDAVDLVASSLEQIESGAARRSAARLARAWAQSRLDELGDYERWCECVSSERDQAFLRRLNDERNPQLAARIEALHAQGRRALAAVGALHMTGPQALPLLLQQRGFSVERVVFAP